MSDIRQHRRPLWQIAQDFMRELFALFGDPSAIAARHTIVRAHWRQLAQWLRHGETLMRLLLAVEAAALPKPNARAPLLNPRRARAKKLVGFEADAPETWRVNFRVFTHDRVRRRRAPGVGGRKDDPFDAARFHSAWPLAERAEALLRVFNDPAPYAARLSRRLHATPHRAESLLVYPEDTAHVGAAPLALVLAEAKTALARFNSS